ncbi:uncharacterized protein LOC116259965 isoform X2 [Nymphaea colorata]|nr:uncharacterized protein LOC116259965 isoform X2 [Nymphaea colorata]
MVSGMSDECLLEICKLKASAAFLPMLSSKFGNFEVFGATEIPGKLMATAGALGRITGLAFVDCSASSETVGLLNQVIELGCCVVLANKKPLTSDMEVYDKLVSHPRRIRYESTVGAGLPVITSLNRILSSGDPINRIVGSLSGTLGYLMSELEDGKPFSQVVRAAKNLGFTEPDPRDDFGGMDVARKALILARLLGWRINMENIKVDSLYPAEMGPNMISTEEFLSKGVLMLDNDFAQRVQLASSNGKVLRYVCMLEKSSCQVGLLECPKDSPLGKLKGSANMVEIYSRCYSFPLVIQGAGAGNDTTAAGVLADILDLQDLFC